MLDKREKGMGRFRASLVSGVWVLLVSVAVFGVALNVPLASGSGTIYIHADGSIDPPTAPISTVDNVTYTFTDNIYDEIVVERSNIIIDGNGYTLQGSGSGYGFLTVSGVNNMTIKNTNIKSFNYGIDLSFSSNNWITKNNITNNRYGIQLIYSSNNVLRSNNMANNTYNFRVYGSSLPDFLNDVDTSNSVDGKSIYYWINKRDLTVPLDAGYVALVNCTRITAQNLNLTNNGDGALLAYTTNSTITNNDITNNEDSIELVYSSNNTITQNRIANNNDGIYLHTSSNKNTILGNNITNNRYGLSFWEASDLHQSCNNTISGNNITNNDEGVVLWYRFSYNVLFANNITNNLVGIKLYYASYNSIFGNSITNNNYTAIGLGYFSNDNIIFRNNIIKNGRGFYFSESSNNKLYHNNVINNSLQVISYDSTNVWDDGYPSGGNYWGDYLERYPDAEELDGSGLWDTPYIIDENNQDLYPLIYPYGTQTYKLTITTTSGGTTTPSPGIHTYANGTIAEVTAIPHSGYSFAYWLLDGENRTENPITIVMDANYTLEARFVDDIQPEISDPLQDPPEDIEPYQNVTVTVNVTDYGTGVYNVTLWYSTDNGTTWKTLNMTELSAGTYQATIPGHEYCTWVSYRIVAYDNAGNNATKYNLGYYYKYHVIPEFPPSLILPLFLTSTLLAAIFCKRKQKPKSKTT